MSSSNETLSNSKKPNSKLKRLPNNSYTILINFENIEERNECINLKEYKEIISKLKSLGSKYNCKVQDIAITE